MAHDVFISYAHKDKPVADAVCATLESRGVRCWIAPRDVLPGEEYASALVTAVRESRLLVLVFSADANASPQVLREVERAVSRGLPILPFRIEDVAPSAAMEYYISSRHWLDALTTPMERHLVHLADTITLLLTRTAPEPRAGAPEPAVLKVPVTPPPEPPPEPVTSSPRVEAVVAPVAAPLPPPAAAPPAASQAPAREPPPRPRAAVPGQPRGGILVAVLLLSLIASLGSSRGYELQNMLGMSSSSVRLLYTAQFLARLAGFLLGARWLSKKGPRNVGMLAAGVLAAGLLLSQVLIASGNGGLGPWLLSEGLLTGLGSGLAWIAAITVAISWYPERRGLIGGLSAAAFIGGSALAWLIGSRLGFSVGIFAGVVACVAALVAARGLKPAPTTAIGVIQGASPAWLLLGFVFLANTWAGTIANASPWAGRAAGFAIVAGSILWAATSDRFDRRRILLGVLLLQGGWAVFMSLVAYPSGAAWIVFYFFNAAAFAMMPALVRDDTDDTSFSWTYAMLLTAWVLGKLLAGLGLGPSGLAPPPADIRITGTALIVAGIVYAILGRRRATG